MSHNKNILYISAACIFSCAFFLTFEYIFTGGQMGVPLDDTWIHFQFADNFAKGYFYQYNIGEYTAGTTSPLYVIVLGITSLVINNFIVSSVLLSSLFYILSCIYIYKISLLIFKSEHSPLKYFPGRSINAEYISLLIALLTAFTGRIVWSALSGMETTMFIFFCIIGVYFHIKNLQSSNYNLLPSLFLSLAAVSRPEGYLLYLLYVLDVLANFIKDKSLKTNLLKVILSVILFSAITLPYLFFSYSISGNFFPNTFRGQGGGFSLIPNFNYLRIAVIYFFRDNFIVGILYLFSFYFYIAHIKDLRGKMKDLNLVFLWTLVLPLAMSILIPNWRHHVRYLIPLLPFVNLIAVYLLLSILNSNRFEKLKSRVTAKRYLLSLVIVVSLVYYVVYAVAIGRNTDNINNQQVKLAYWVKENVGQNETIALNDIGAIKFINKNRVIDMAGLITPEILKYRTYTWNDNLDSINYLLKKNNVSYIIIYDHWFSEYLNKYENTLTYVTSAVLEDNTICGGIEMKVYKTNFNRKVD